MLAVGDYGSRHLRNHSHSSLPEIVIFYFECTAVLVYIQGYLHLTDLYLLQILGNGHL